MIIRHHSCKLDTFLTFWASLSNTIGGTSGNISSSELFHLQRSHTSKWCRFYYLLSVVDKDTHPKVKLTALDLNAHFCSQGLMVFQYCVEVEDGQAFVILLLQIWLEVFLQLSWLCYFKRDCQEGQVVSLAIVWEVDNDWAYFGLAFLVLLEEH